MPLRPTVNSFWARLFLYLHLGLYALVCCGYAEAPETFAQALKGFNPQLKQLTNRWNSIARGQNCSSDRNTWLDSFKGETARFEPTPSYWEHLFLILRTTQ
jgi:hypothetical protein